MHCSSSPMDTWVLAFHSFSFSHVGGHQMTQARVSLQAPSQTMPSERFICRILQIIHSLHHDDPQQVANVSQARGKEFCVMQKGNRAIVIHRNKLSTAVVAAATPPPPLPPTSSLKALALSQIFACTLHLNKTRSLGRTQINRSHQVWQKT